MILSAIQGWQWDGWMGLSGLCAENSWQVGRRIYFGPWWWGLSRCQGNTERSNFVIIHSLFFFFFFWEKGSWRPILRRHTRRVYKFMDICIYALPFFTRVRLRFLCVQIQHFKGVQGFQVKDRATRAPTQRIKTWIINARKTFLENFWDSKCLSPRFHELLQWSIMTNYPRPLSLLISCLKLPPLSYILGSGETATS